MNIPDEAVEVVRGCSSCGRTEAEAETHCSHLNCDHLICPCGKIYYRFAGPGE